LFFRVYTKHSSPIVLQADILDRGFEEGATVVKWDQFEENERKFGIILDGYNESEYTVPLDTNSPNFEERKRRAEALALEIRSGRAGCRNVHIREELDLPPIGETVDEETLYSTVNAPSSTNMLRLGLKTDEQGGETVSKEQNMHEEAADSEGPVEDWKLDLDAPEYEPLPGGLAALPDEVKELLPFIADMLAPSLQRILVDSGFVPPCVLEENRENMASVTLESETAPLTCGGDLGGTDESGHMLGGPHMTRSADTGPGSDCRREDRTAGGHSQVRPSTGTPVSGCNYQDTQGFFHAVGPVVHQIGTPRGPVLRPQAPPPQQDWRHHGEQKQKQQQQQQQQQRRRRRQQDWRHHGERICTSPSAAAAAAAAAAIGGDGGLHGVPTAAAAVAEMSAGGSVAGRVSWASIVRAGTAAGAAATASNRV
jgi:hypothetical protein